MFKKTLFITALLVVSFAGHSQRVDSMAVFLLQQSAATLQSMESCRFNADIMYDVWNDELGYFKNAQTEEVSITFPDKLAINAQGSKGHYAMLFDGQQFTWYSYANNQYAQTNYTGSVVQAMDTLNKTYQIEFPAADFFYPSFVSDVLSTGGSLVYLGIMEVNGTPCFHIAGKDEAGTGFQFWISNDNLYLPVRMILVYNTTNGHPQYEATYSDWQINPVSLPSSYLFTAPPGASKVKMSSSINR